MAGRIILTGDRPTGRLHIGHYVRSGRYANAPWDGLQLILFFLPYNEVRFI